MHRKETMNNVNERDREGETLLYKAAKAGDVKKCEELLENGAKTEITNDFYRLTPLTIAAGEGYVDVCKVLIDAGADVNAVDNDGCTAFNIAKDNHNAELLEILSNTTV